MTSNDQTPEANAKELEPSLATHEHADHPDMTHVPHMEGWAYNQMPKTGERDLRLMRFDGTDLYAWFGKVKGSVFEDLLNGPFVIRPAPAALEGSSSSVGERFTPVTGVWKNQSLGRLDRVRAYRMEFGGSISDAVEAVDQESTRQSLNALAALHPSSAADAKPVAWWCEKPDGTGFSTDFDPGDWPNLTVHRLFKGAQPHTSQQAGAEGEREKLIGLQIEAHPMDKHYAVMCEITPDGADAILTALKPVEG